MSRTNASVGVLGCLGILIALVAWIALISWVIMVVFGAIAVNVGWSTISYGTAVLASILLTVVGGFFKGGS